MYVLIVINKILVVIFITTFFYDIILYDRVMCMKLNYKCSSCGGKLSYKENSTKLKCAFCNKEYDNFVKVGDIDFSDYDLASEIDCYICPNCEEHVSLKEYNDYSVKKCCSCGHSLNKSKALASGVADSFYGTWLTAKNVFLNELMGVKKYIPSVFLNSEFSFKYINSRLYDGVIIVEANSISGKRIEKKYVFFDLIIPNSKHLSNKDKLQFAMNKINVSKIVFDSAKVKENLDSQVIEFSSNKKTDLSLIENACLNEFKSKHKGLKNYKVNSFLTIRNNIYVPVYQSKVVYNNKTYYNTILNYSGLDDESKNVCCLNFPKISDSVSFLLNFRYIILFLLVLFVKFIFMIPILVVLYYNVWISFDLILVGACLFLISLIMFFPMDFLKKASRQNNLYLNSEDISEEEFYEILVDSKTELVGHSGR